MSFGAFATLLVAIAFTGLVYWVLHPSQQGALGVVREPFRSTTTDDAAERRTRRR